MTDRSFRCSHASEAEDEPLLGTASTITNWLLVEHPGPWGEKALRHARLPAGLGDMLRRRERELKIRVLLIRRHGRRTGARRSCFAIHTGPDRPWMERADLEDVRDVAALDLEGLGRGASVGLTPIEGALFAVCTHGRRDPCCAERGRPLASALSHAFPEQTWESTHIGGDRFAGNMIAFPTGSTSAGSIPPPGSRSRPATSRARSISSTSGDAPADRRTCRRPSTHLRARHALTGIDDVTVIDVSRAGTETFATFRTPLGSHRVGVRRELGPEERLTCHSEATQRPPRFELLGIEAV